MDNLRIMRVCLLSAACATYLGCSSSDGGLINPPPVHAQTYSNSSLNGTYTVVMGAGEAAAIVSPVSFLGSMIFDGNGNITSGTITEASTPYSGSTVTCSVSASGIYSLSSDATGTATVNFSGSIVSSTANPASGAIGNGNNCWAIPPTLSLAIAAAQQGDVVAFQMASGAAGFNFAGTAYKQ